jgi:hypothetical protein
MREPLRSYKTPLEALYGHFLENPFHNVFNLRPESLRPCTSSAYSNASRIARLRFPLGSAAPRVSFAHCAICALCAANLVPSFSPSD